MKQKGLALFESQDESISLRIKMNDDTVWLNRGQISTLFERDGKHIANALSKKLGCSGTVSNFATADYMKVLKAFHKHVDKGTNSANDSSKKIDICLLKIFLFRNIITKES